MAIDDIKKIAAAEQAAQAAKETALQEARNRVTAAQNEAQLLMDKSRTEAMAQVKQMIAQSENEAESETKSILARAEANCNTLRQQAQEKLDGAAQLITERVVNSQWQS